MARRTPSASVARSLDVMPALAIRKRGATGEASTYADEAGGGAIQESLAGRLGPQEAQHEHFEIAVAGGICHHGPATVDRAQQLGDPIRTAEAEIVDRDEGHILGPDLA